MLVTSLGALPRQQKYMLALEICPACGSNPGSRKVRPHLRLALVDAVRQAATHIVKQKAVLTQPTNQPHGAMEDGI